MTNDATMLIRLPSELRDRIESLAKDEQRSTAAMTRILLERALSEQPKGRPLRNNAATNARKG